MKIMKSFLKFKVPDHDHDPRLYEEESHVRESRLYKPFRYIGLLLGILAIVFGAIGLESSSWMVIKEWQLAVIALILFSLGFSLLASILALCGLCALQLPKKVYFYHSAAEIYFVCALSSTTALVTYPLVMELQETVPSAHTYSWGYMVGWGAPACFYISSICMSMDDMIHSVSKGCNALSLCGMKKSHRTPMNHV